MHRNGLTASQPVSTHKLDKLAANGMTWDCDVTVRQPAWGQLTWWTQKPCPIHGTLALLALCLANTRTQKVNRKILRIRFFCLLQSEIPVGAAIIHVWPCLEISFSLCEASKCQQRLKCNGLYRPSEQSRDEKNEEVNESSSWFDAMLHSAVDTPLPLPLSFAVALCAVWPRPPPDLPLNEGRAPTIERLITECPSRQRARPANVSWAPMSWLTQSTSVSRLSPLQPPIPPLPPPTHPPTPPFSEDSPVNNAGAVPAGVTVGRVLSGAIGESAWGKRVANGWLRQLVRPLLPPQPSHFLIGQLVCCRKISTGCVLEHWQEFRG